MAILTISREFGSGGREIGRAVAESMGYAYVDKEKILHEISAKGKKWETWSKDLDERCPTVWERYDWSFRGFGALVQNAILHFAMQDKAVIVGRGGNFVLRDVPHALTVRVTASLAARLERIMLRESVDRSSAEWLIEKTDRERACFIYSLYGKHWDDPAEYECVFNAGERSDSQIAAALVELLQDKEKHNTEAARTMLAMLVRASDIKAGLLTDPAIFIPTLDVFPEGGTVVLRGIIHNPKELQRIEAAAIKLAAGTPIKCEFHHRR